jgi:hypothetical protein
MVTIALICSFSAIVLFYCYGFTINSFIHFWKPVEWFEFILLIMLAVVLLITLPKLKK